MGWIQVWTSLMARKRGAKTTEMIAISFIRMLSAGPDVSLRGSPTVSPVTAALKICDFLVATCVCGEWRVVSGE